MSDPAFDKLQEFVGDLQTMEVGKGLTPTQLIELAKGMILKGWHKDHWVPLKSGIPAASMPTVEGRVH